MTLLAVSLDGSIEGKGFKKCNQMNVGEMNERGPQQEIYQALWMSQQILKVKKTVA